MMIRLICDWIAKGVTQLGHRAFYAHTLQEGLRKAQSEPFDIVFIDVRLPDGTAWTSFRRSKPADSFLKSS